MSLNREKIEYGSIRNMFSKKRHQRYRQVLKKGINRRIRYALFGLVALTTGLVFAEAGNLRYSVMVNKFENKANWTGRWNLGDAWGTVFTDQLVQSGKFIVLGEADMRGAAIAEQDFAASGRAAGGKKAPKMGRSILGTFLKG